jgi:hypothetical protein
MLPKKKKEKKVLLPTAVSKSAAHTVLIGNPLGFYLEFIFLQVTMLNMSKIKVVNTN